MWKKNKKRRRKNSVVVSNKLDWEIWILLPPQINCLLQVVWYGNKLPSVVGKNQQKKSQLLFQNFYNKLK